MNNNVTKFFTGEYSIAYSFRFYDGNIDHT